MKHDPQPFYLTEGQPIFKGDEPALDEAKEELRREALRLGALVFGVASPDEVAKRAPKGHTPEDFLPGVKSVVVVGGGKMLAGAWRCRDPRWVGVLSSLKLRQVKEVSFKLAEFIEERFGYYAVPYASYSLSRGVWDPDLSIKLCAELAGLGTRSMAGGVVCLLYTSPSPRDRG